MKKLLACVLAAALAVGMAVPLGAAAPALATNTSVPKYSASGESAVTRYNTAAYHNRNSISMELEGSVLRIGRKSLRLNSGPDHIIVSLSGSQLLDFPVAWSALPDGGYGYSTAVNLGALGDGQYTLTVKSTDEYVYKVDETGFEKSGGVCRFPQSNLLSRQYHYDLFRRLENGQVPDDFAELEEDYGTGDDRKVLDRIRAKALELTRGLSRDVDKVLAVEWWISQNIAYDMDLAGDQYFAWIEDHPGDKSRLDSPLHAFTEQYALCYGYARLTVLMLGYAGVESIYLRGHLTSGGDIDSELRTALSQDQMNHAWNAVKVDGGWYYLDTCANAVKKYYRTDMNEAATGYTDAHLAPTYLHTFPSMDFISRSHAPIRYGVKSYGTKLEAAAIPAGWQGDAFYVDSSRLRDTWAEIDGELFFFNGAGRRATGWTLSEGYWRFFDPDGKLTTGEVTLKEGDSENTFRFDSGGRLTGDGAGEWLTFAGAARYLKGRDMLTGWNCVEGAWRYFDDDGALYRDAEKPLVLEDREYLVDEEGALRLEGSGWVELGENKIYLDGSRMRTGFQRIRGKEYLFSEDGALLTGWQTHDGKTYLIDEEGVVKTGWQFHDGAWYYIDRTEGRYTGAKSVVGKPCFFNAQGQLSGSGWADLGSTRLYFKDGEVKNNVPQGGALLKGWRVVEGKLRFFDYDTGALYTGSEPLYNPYSKKNYTFDGDGVATEQK